MDDGKWGQAYLVPTVPPTTQRGISKELLPLCRNYVLENHTCFWIVAENGVIINKIPNKKTLAVTAFSFCADSFSVRLSFESRLRREGFTVQVSVNDYLDIYCPHYNSSQRGRLERVVAEQYILYMVNYHGYRSCDPKGGSKRWECNKPHAPHAPIKFSEKFQRYSAFSLGYEFNVGKEYYYISTPTHHHGHSCLRLRVYVCCSTASQADDDSGQTSPDYTVRPNIKIQNIDEFNPEVPKLEKSVSGSSPSRDRLLLTVAVLLASGLLLS
uniref:Ephrin-A3a n=1 Tax=Oryzias latipes TaxID=8090 RepID=A0A3P9MBW5_ORYLA